MSTNKSSKQLKIIIADDHFVVRQGLKQILINEFGSILIEEAGNTCEVLIKAREQKWDIIILDINMPGRNGLEALQDLKKEHPDIPVLMLSMFPEKQVAIRILKSGGHGFVSKEAANRELIIAIKQVFSGKKYISASVAEQLANNFGTQLDKAPHELLSNREFETLLLIASGKPVSQVADELALSVPTVSTYRARIFEKMLLRNNAELTKYCIVNSLI